LSKEIIYQRLQVVFDNVFLTEVKVVPTLSAKDVEEWDSIVHLSLVLGIEEDFRIRFKVGEMESANNIEELVNVIAAKLA